MTNLTDEQLQEKFRSLIAEKDKLAREAVESKPKVDSLTIDELCIELSNTRRLLMYSRFAVLQYHAKEIKAIKGEAARRGLGL